MSIETMKLALDAVQDIKHHMDPDEYAWEKATSVIQALEQAIAKAEKRKWIGLKPKQRREIFQKLEKYTGEEVRFGEFYCRVIEAKLKEKNT